MNAGDPQAETLHVEVGGRTWDIQRPGDLESLWAGMAEDDFGEDERIPYWVEIWPAGLLLARWLHDQGALLQGRRCLDVGCGLGLTSCVAADKGARVVGMDYEVQALVYARRNAALNGVSGGMLVQTDWRRPGLKPGVFDLVWGGDIFYESRSFEPLSAMLERVLAPGGTVWITEPVREVSLPVWGRLMGMGWTVSLVTREQVNYRGYSMRVNLRQLRRSGPKAGKKQRS